MLKYAFETFKNAPTSDVVLVNDRGDSVGKLCQ